MGELAEKLKALPINGKTNKRGFVTYEESNPYLKVIEFLVTNHYSAVCSPLHDHDVWTEQQVLEWCADRLTIEGVKVTPDMDSYERNTGEVGRNQFGGGQAQTQLVLVPKPGDLKKAHRHWYVEYEYSKPTSTMMEEFKVLDICYLERIKSKRAYIRYMCHLDNGPLRYDHANKYKYKVEDVISMGGIDISCLYTMDDGQKFEQDKDIYQIIRENDIHGYSQLVHYLRANNYRQMYAEVKHNNYFWREELKGIGFDVMEVTGGTDGQGVALTVA